MNPTDFLGREIRPGDLIVYPWRRGSQMGLNKLNVQMVTPEAISGFSNTGRPVKITNLKNVVIVEPPQVSPSETV
jgi:hypothetical protein